MDWTAQPGNECALGVASDGTDFLVIWSDAAGLHGRRTSAAGGLQDDELVFTIEDVQEAGAVACGDGQYLVAWVEGTDGAHRTKARFVSSSGHLGDARLLSRDDSYHYNPLSVAYGDGRFLVVWHHNSGPDDDWDLRGRIVLADGTLPRGGDDPDKRTRG